MDHSLSVDEVLDSVWTVPPPMQQSQVGCDCGGVVASENTATTAGGQDATDPSEWSFERFLEEELMGNTTPLAVDSSAGSVFHTEEPVPVDHAVEVELATMPANGTADPVEYNTMLKRKLEEDLAAIAMWRASGTVNQEISQGSYAYNGGSRNPAQNKPRDGRGQLVQNSDICAKLPARSSSMEPSPTEDDDMDAGEVEILGFRMPDAEKMKKRKQSNRESARRSRTRRAAHLKDLEDQVTHLRVENSLLLRRLDAIKQQYSATAVDNRILRADMETLRTKVKMAEDTVNRLIGTSLPSFSSMPYIGSSSHATLPADLSVSIQDNNITNYYYTAAAASGARVNNHSSYMPRAAPSPLQAEGVVHGSSNTTTINGIAASRRATAMELLEERMMSDTPSSSAIDGAAALGLDEITDANMEVRHLDRLIGTTNMDDIMG